MAFGGNYDPQAATIQTANETDHNSSDMNTVSSKIITAHVGKDGKMVPSGGRNARSLTVEVRAQAKAESQRQQRRISPNGGSQKVVKMAPDPAPKILLSQD